MQVQLRSRERYSEKPRILGRVYDRNLQRCLHRSMLPPVESGMSDQKALFLVSVNQI